MACDEVAQHTVYARLPLLTRGLEIGQHLRAIAHRDKLLHVLGLGTAAQWNHGLQLFRRERLCVGIRFGRGCDRLSSFDVGVAMERRLDTLDIVFYLATIGSAQADDAPE